MYYRVPWGSLQTQYFKHSWSNSHHNVILLCYVWFSLSLQLPDFPNLQMAIHRCLLHIGQICISFLWDLRDRFHNNDSSSAAMRWDSSLQQSSPVTAALCYKTNHHEKLSSTRTSPALMQHFSCTKKSQHSPLSTQMLLSKPIVRKARTNVMQTKRTFPTTAVHYRMCSSILNEVSVIFRPLGTRCLENISVLEYRDRFFSRELYHCLFSIN